MRKVIICICLLSVGYELGVLSSTSASNILDKICSIPRGKPQGVANVQ